MSKPISPIIKIAPTDKEKAEQKRSEKIVNILASEKKGKSMRDMDLFVGGPMDGEVVPHQPNGPRAPNDPKGNWSDYYIADTLVVEEGGSKKKIKGYHLYSSSKGFHTTFNETVGRHTYDAHKHANFAGLGTRGPNMMKMYYYVAFLDDRALVLDGIIIGEFLHGKISI